MNKCMVLALAYMCAGIVFADEILISPGDDLSAKFATVGDFDTVRFVAGTYEFRSEIALASRQGVTICGASAATTVLKVADGVSSRHFALSGCSDIAFRNLTFRDGKLLGSGTETVSGGAVLSTDSGVSFTDCVFTNNRLEANNADMASYYARGGCISATGGSLGVTNCVFKFNAAHGNAETGGMGTTDSGACIYSDKQPMDVYNSLFVRNAAGSPASLGMGVVFINSRLTSGGDVKFERCTFAANVSANTIYEVGAAKSSSAQIVDCIVIGGYNDVGHKNQGVKFTTVRSVLGRTIGSVYPYDAFKSEDHVYAKPEFLPDYSLPPTSPYYGKGYSPSVAYAGNSRIIHVATDGSDETGTGTSDAPYGTIAKAVAQATAGDAIRVHAGTYSATATGEPLPLNLSGKEFLTLEGEGEVVLDAENAPERNLLSMTNSAYLTVRNLTLQHGNQTMAIEGGISMPSAVSVEECAEVSFEGIAVRSCTFLGNQPKVGDEGLEGAHWKVKRSLGVAVTGCSIANCSAQKRDSGKGLFGGVFFAGVADVVIDRCAFTSNFVGALRSGCYGIYFSGNNCGGRSPLDNGGRGELRNSIIARNYHSSSLAAGSFFGVGSVSGAEMTIDNCTIVSNANYLVQNTVPAYYFRNCILKGNCSNKDGATGSSAKVMARIFLYTALSDIADGNYSTSSTNVISGVYGFQDESKDDYSITKESDAVDAGESLEWMGDASLDFSGGKRCVGYLVRKNRIPDIGACELQRMSGLMLIVR